MNQLILAIILTLLPVSELRGGMPLAVNYAIKNNFSIIPFVTLIILLNCLVVFFLFFFLDKFHNKLLTWRIYNQFYQSYLRRLRKKIDKFEQKHASYGMLALTLFVAIPFPTTGAWTGSFIAWLLGLDRKKSIIAIMLGVVISGIIVSLASLGIISLFF